MIVEALATLALVAPAGFREAPALEPAASYAAGKPVAVYCAASAEAFAAGVTTMNAPPTETGSFAESVGGSASYLAPLMCGPLGAALHKPNATSYVTARAILALVHESVHLRGEAAENVTDCTALQLMPGIASRFFGFKTWRARHLLMELAWAAHDAKPPAYHGCANGLG